jgi:hypothetical protein
MADTRYPGTLPVDQDDRKASSHRAWLVKNADAHDTVQQMLAQLLGGDGVLVAGAAPYAALKAQATSPVSLALDVLPGAAVAAGTLWRLAQTLRTAAFAAPVAAPRIDLIQLNLATRAVEVLTGDEAAEPEAPTVGADAVELAYVHWRVGAASIKDADDATNAYLEDRRAFVGLKGVAGTFERVQTDALGTVVGGQRRRMCFELTASGAWPATTNGCEAAELDANDVLGCAFAAGKRAVWHLGIPNDFAGLSRVTLYSAGDGAAEWKFYTRVRANGGALDGSFSAFATTLSVTHASGQQLITTNTADFAALLGSGGANANKELDFMVELVSGDAVFHLLVMEWA